jgi:hypothetical protein
MWSWQSGQLLASVFNYAGPGGYRRRERSEAIQQSLGPGYVRDITYSSLVVPAWSATRWLGSPAFTDVFVRRESLQGLRPPSVVASINEVGKVIFELIVSIVMIALNSGYLDRSVHASTWPLVHGCLISVSRCSMPFSRQRISNICVMYLAVGPFA